MNEYEEIFNGVADTADLSLAIARAVRRLREAIEEEHTCAETTAHVHSLTKTQPEALGNAYTVTETSCTYWPTSGQMREHAVFTPASGDERVARPELRGRLKDSGTHREPMDSMLRAQGAATTPSPVKEDLMREGMEKDVEGTAICVPAMQAPTPTGRKRDLGGAILLAAIDDYQNADEETHQDAQQFLYPQTEEWRNQYDWAVGLAEGVNAAWMRDSLDRLKLQWDAERLQRMASNRRTQVAV